MNKLIKLNWFSEIGLEELFIKLYALTKSCWICALTKKHSHKKDVLWMCEYSISKFQKQKKWTDTEKHTTFCQKHVPKYLRWKEGKYKKK